MKKNIHLRHVPKLIAKSDCELSNACPSVYPHGTTPLPLDAFSWNFIWVFCKNLRRNFKIH